MARGFRIEPSLGVLIDPLAEREFARGHPPEHAYPHLGPLFRRRGHSVAYFSPGGADLAKRRVTGWSYGPRGWEQGVFPLPYAVYNRLARRSLEKSRAGARLLGRLREQGLFFNPGYLRKDAALRALAAAGVPTPGFVQARSPGDVFQALAAWNAVYLKPVGGSLGRGIVAIGRVRGDGAEARYQIVANGPPGSPPSRARLGRRDLASFLERRLLGDAYIAQEAVPLARIDGRAVDLRVLVQRTAGAWRLTGAAGRLASPGQATTHTVRGGQAVPLSNVIAVTGLDERALEELACRAADAVAEAAGPGYFEFSADVAVTPSGALWVLEVNAKPFPFDEEEIRTLAALRLLDYVIEEPHRARVNRMDSEF